MAPRDRIGIGDDAAPPFVAGPPIADPRRFFGRGREIRRLFGLWRNVPRQNAAIIGPPRSGKTSLLHYLRAVTTAGPAALRPGQQADWLPDPDRYRWVYVDFQDPRLGGRERLLRHLLAGLGLPAAPSGDFEAFLDTVAEHLRGPAIIQLDEIGVALERYSELDDAFWEGLRSLATNQTGGNLAFVLACQEPPDRLARHSGLGSPFFNIFGYTTTLGPLTDPEARELIASSPVAIPDDDVEWILEQSGRWPVLLQILCRERLAASDDPDALADWRADARRQMDPFRHLIAGR